MATEKTEILCDAPAAFAAPGPDGTIPFSPDERFPIHKVSARGGTPVQVTTLDVSRHYQAHRWPQFLPDGRHFIYMPWKDDTTLPPSQPRCSRHAVAHAVRGTFGSCRCRRLPGVCRGDSVPVYGASVRRGNTLQLQGTPFSAVTDDNA